MGMKHWLHFNDTPYSQLPYSKMHYSGEFLHLCFDQSIDQYKGIILLVKLVFDSCLVSTSFSGKMGHDSFVVENYWSLIYLRTAQSHLNFNEEVLIDEPLIHPSNFRQCYSLNKLYFEYT
jgi:hypothetical protein